MVHMSEIHKGASLGGTCAQALLECVKKRKAGRQAPRKYSTLNKPKKTPFA